MDASMDSPFAYSRGPPVQYVMQRFDGSAVFTRGVLVLRWASEQIRADKDLVWFLVWSNPSNLCFASVALQADHDIVATALQSPYYWEEQQKTSSALVLLNAAESLRARRETAGARRRCAEWPRARVSRGQAPRRPVRRGVGWGSARRLC